MSLIRIGRIHAVTGLGVCLASMALALATLAQSISTTTVQGTVYLANGSPGSGTLQISWPAFTTASNQAVAAGKITAAIGADGFVSVNLAPNLGSSPAGLYYTAVYQMSDGTTSTEYWVVKAAAQATIAQVRSQIMPAAQAVQAVSKAYVDQAIQSVSQGNLTSTGGQLTGPLYLTGDPTQSLQAADKHYVDTSFAQALPLTGGMATGPLTATQLGAAHQVDQFAGADFGAKLQACLAAVNSAYGGTCDARNFPGTLSMASNLTVSTANTAVLLPCATISTSNQIIVAAGTRNVSLRGCALRGASKASGSQGGTVLLYSGTGAAIQVGDATYATDTLGFHLDNVVINTAGSTSSAVQAFAAYRAQELDLESVYLLGNSNQTGMTLDGTGNYTGGTFYDNHISGFQTAINGIGHQITNSAATDWMNASTFVRLHIDCPTANGNPISGTYGVNLQQGDGNTFTGGDVENCGTALHLGMNAQNNTIVGLRNENSTYQVVADPGSSYNSWITGGTMFTGKLSDNGTRNSFLDAFHRSFNSLNGDWYGSQQDATLTNHFRLGVGSGNERGLLDRYQTDSGYRWTMGLSDATGGEQFYQLLDELNNVYRISVGQYNSGEASTNDQTVINSAGTGAVVLNGSNNSGTGGVVFGSGGPNETTVGTVSNAGNAQFNGTLQVGGAAQSAGTMTVRNNADAEVDYYLWPGLSASQKGSFTYKDYNGNSQWYMVKDASNNWALNSAAGGLDSFKAYQSTNSGDTYVNAANASGVVRVNYEPGSGSAFNIYGGNTSNLYASFSGSSSIKLPGISASSGHNCLQIDSSGYISNTGAACGSGSGSGTVNSGSAGQIAYYNNNGTAVSGMSAVPIASGGTGATSASAALAALNGVSSTTTSPQTMMGPLNASVNSQVNVLAYGAKGDCVTDDTAALTAAQTAAFAYQGLPASLFFPKPTGGCYIVNNWYWKGAPLIGQPSGNAGATTSVNVLLKSSPGNDVIHIPDPTTTSGAVTLSAGWQIRNITLQVNNSAAPVTPTYHRWPGRWIDDANVTGGSNVIALNNNYFSCGDVGQAITVGGAGATAATDTLGAAITSANQKSISLTTGLTGSWPSVFAYVKVDSEIMLVEVQGLSNGTVAFTNVQRGQAGTTAATHGSGATVTVMGNLTTTVASVYPCWNSASTHAFNKVTLAANATTTISNAHTYISVLGLPVTENIGNCAIAMDDMDGLSSDWAGTTSGGNYGKIENLEIEGTSGSNNDVCGIFVQGIPYLYGVTVNNFMVSGGKYGVVQATTELNSTQQSSSGDYEHWSDGIFFFPWTPWISYNGLNQTWDNIQITSFAGPQILQTSATSGDVPVGWHIRNSGMETPYTPTAYGWRVEGGFHVFDGVSLSSGAAGQTAYWDANASNCLCSGSNIELNGYNNTFQTNPNSIIGGSGYNTASFNYNGNPYLGYPYIYNIAMVPFKGTYNMAGRFTGDFAFDANPSANYVHDDLILWPQDIVVPATSYATTIIQDSTSPSGFYINMNGSLGGLSQFVPFIDRGITGSSIIGGTTLPLNGVTVDFQAKCLSGSSFQLLAGFYGGTQNAGTYSCTSGYQNYSLTVVFKPSDNGKPFELSSNGTTFQASYFVVVPFKGKFNYYQPSLSHNDIVWNFSNWPAWSNAFAATDPGSPYGSVEGEWGGASSNLVTTPGKDYPAVPSKVSYWVGTPSVFNDTLGAAMTSSATSITLGAATTSAWGSSGYILIDGEVMHYSGVSAGLTTITVTRGQYGTIAAAHSNGEAITNVGVGTVSINCNSTTVSTVNVYFAPQYATFTAPFPAQQCAGYQTNIAVLNAQSGAANYYFAQVKIIPDEDWLAVPSAANQVPVSSSNGAMNTFGSTMPLAGTGSGITTGPTSGTTANHVVTFSGASGQIQDGGVGMPLAGTTASIGGSALPAGQCATGTVSIAGATTSMAVAVSPVSNPGSGMVWDGYVSSSGTVTVQVCAIVAGTPAATAYNVRAIP